MNTHSPVFRYAMIGAALVAAFRVMQRRRRNHAWNRRDETLAASFPASDPPPF
jgi:hypothetical protein